MVNKILQLTLLGAEKSPYAVVNSQITKQFCIYVRRDIICEVSVDPEVLPRKVRGNND
jgi:hypothetical protein